MPGDLGLEAYELFEVDVGRIRDDQVERPFETCEELALEQLDTNLDALAGPAFTDQELAAIDADAVDSGVNLWAKQTED